MRRISELAVALVGAMSITTPAWAGMVPPASPGPVIGLGIPALAAFGLAYRRLRKPKG